MISKNRLAPPCHPLDVVRQLCPATVPVTGAGNRTVDEITPLHVRHPSPLPVRPLRELKCLADVTPPSGATRKVMFPVVPDSVTSRDVESAVR